MPMKLNTGRHGVYQLDKYWMGMFEKRMIDEI